MQQEIASSPYDKYWNCFIFEAIGSFFIVFTIQMAHNHDYGVFAIALSFFLSVFLAANMSGAHLNSAVTLCIFLNETKSKKAGSTPVEKYYGYVIAQIVGGTVAGLLASSLHGDETIVALGVKEGVNGSTAFVYEMLYTGLLCFMVSIICDENYNPKPEPALIGLLVAGVIFVQANAIGSTTGGVINPSIGISLLLAKALGAQGFIQFNRVFLYILAPCVGAFGAHWGYETFIKPFLAPTTEGVTTNSGKEVLLKEDRELA